MLSVSPVSNNVVRFRGNETASTNILERDGAFSKSKVEESSAQAQMPGAETPEEKKSGSGKKVLGAVIGLVAVAAALAALPKVFPSSIKALSDAELKDAKFGKKVGHYFAKVGNAIAKYTYEPIVNLFKGKGAKKTTDAAKDAAKDACKIFA